jgi:ribosomal protein S18 acetylase RimI-like enzyme
MTQTLQLRHARLADCRDLARVHIETWRHSYAGIVPAGYLSGMSVEGQARNWRNWIAHRGRDEVILVVEKLSLPDSAATEGQTGQEDVTGAPGSGDGTSPDGLTAAEAARGSPGRAGKPGRDGTNGPAGKRLPVQKPQPVKKSQPAQKSQPVKKSQAAKKLQTAGKQGPAGTRGPAESHGTAGSPSGAAESRIIGFGHAGPARGTELSCRGEVYSLYVDIDWQGMGIGRQLLGRLFGDLLAAGLNSSIIWVLAGNPSRYFYEAVGGIRRAERQERFAGVLLDEVGYVWPDSAAMAALISKD